MKIAKNFKKIVACLLAFAVVFTCIGSALAVSAEETAPVVTNGNGNATDVGIWYTPYNCTEFFANRFANPKANPVGYKALLPDGSYGIPFAGDTDIMDFYIQEMAKAGIDFVLFDTTNGGLSPDLEFGWDENEYGGNRWIVKYAKMFAERLSKWNETHAWKIRYALSIGTYDDAQTDTLTNTAEYQAQGVLDAFVNDSVIGDDYYIFDGKPLITLFDWECVAENQTDIMIKMDEEDSALSKFTVRSSSIGQEGTYSWNNNGNGGAALYDEEVVTVCPGHAQQGANTPTDSRRDGATYQENWDVVLNAAKAPRVVMISSFNDYMENTAVFVTNTDDCVETNAEEKWDNPYQYWDMTVNSIKALRAAAGDSTDFSTGYENYALTATPSSNSTILWPEGTSGWNKIANINDGKGTSGARALFLANDGNNKTVNFNLTFDSAKTINNVLVYAVNEEAPAYGFKHVAVDVLVDGNWKRVAEVHDLAVSNKEVVPFYFAPVNATAVRVSINTRGQGNSGVAGIQEIEVYNNPTVAEKDYTGVNAPSDAATGFAAIKPANVALGGTYSDFDWNQHILGGPKVLCDGKLSNRTGSQIGGSKNPWYQINFVQTSVINNVSIVWDSVQNYTRADFAIDVIGTDGTAVRVAEVHLAEKPAWTAGGTRYEVYFKDIEAAGIRIKFVGSAGEIVSLSELEAYKLDEVPAYTGINIPADAAIKIPGTSTGNLAAASVGSTVSTSLVSGTPTKLAKANDGKDEVNSWSGTYGMWSGAASDWYQITFESPKYINKVVVDLDMAEKLQSKDLAVEVLLEDGTWKRVAAIHNNDEWGANWSGYQTKDRRTFTFEAEKAVAFRLYGNYKTRTRYDFFSVCEIYAYYNYSITEYTGIPTDVPVENQIATNVALNATATGNFPAGYGGGYACLVDGKGFKGSRSAHTFGTGANLYYDLAFDGVKTFNSVNLVWDTLEAPKQNYSKKDFAVEIKTASGEYFLVAEVHLDEKVSMTSANQYVTTLVTFETVEAAGVRVWFNNGGGGLVSLFEIEVFEYEGITEYTGITKTDVFVTSTPTYDPTKFVSNNYALGQKVTSTNTNWSHFARLYPDYKVTDGSAVYNAIDSVINYVNGQASYTVNFDKAYTINKVILRQTAQQGDARPDEHIIEVKTADGWVRVASMAATQSQGHLEDTFYFEAIECTALRVVGNNKQNTAKSENFKLNEIEAYYDSSVTEDIYTGFVATDAQYTAGIQGDVDGDSWITAIDLAYALNWYTRARERVAGNAAIMDTNRDGKYDIRDYIYLVEEVAVREANLAGLNK